MLKFKMFMLHLLSSLQQENGSLRGKVRVIFFTRSTLELETRKRNSERNLSNCVMKIPLWSDVLAHLDLDFLPPNLINHMFFKKSYPFSDNFPKMSRILLESCAWSLWFQWPSIYLKKRTRSIPLEPFLPLVRTSHGK